jgi:hypothetical protein
LGTRALPEVWEAYCQNPIVQLKTWSFSIDIFVINIAKFDSVLSFKVAYLFSGKNFVVDDYSDDRRGILHGLIFETLEVVPYDKSRITVCCTFP